MIEEVSKIKYKVELDNIDCSITVEINDDENTKQLMDMCNKFWFGYQQRLDDENGDITNTFLKLLCGTALSVQQTNDYNLYGVIQEFNDMEGWCRLDGSDGIKLTGIEWLTFTDEPMTIIRKYDGK